jgi:hypothetical protein
MASRSQQANAKATRTLAVVAADFEAIGPPAPIALTDRNATIMASLDT